jgi:fibronectin type 3 domain-containing protein
MKTLLFLLIIPFYMSAQTAGVVHSGPKGIFITIGNHPPGTKHGSYKIERSEGGAFKTVAELHPVKDLNEFRKNMLETQKWVDYPINFDIYNAENIWKKVKETSDVESLKTLGHSLPVVAGFHLLWLDQDVKKGKTYQYRISSKGFELLSERITYQPLAAAPLELKSYQFLNKVFHFKLSAYGVRKPVWIDVYRAGAGKGFEKLKIEAFISNSKDTLQYSLRDSSAIPYQPYKYTFRAYDLYGNQSIENDTIHTASLDPTVLPIPAKVNITADSQKIMLNWTQTSPEIVKSILLERGTSSEGEFLPLHEMSGYENHYSDESTEAGTTYFYRFRVSYKGITDTKQSTLYSAIRHDLRPLSPVLTFVGEETEKGIQLNWTTHESKAVGFHLYRQLNNEGYHLLTEMIPAVQGKQEYNYQDLNPGEGKTYHYYIRTISRSYQEGIPSDTLTLISTRNLPEPKAPVDISLQAVEDKIWLTWQSMPEVAGYVILREKGNRKDTLYTEKNFYVDEVANATYRIKSVNWSGVSSPYTNPVKYSKMLSKPAPPGGILVSPERNGGMKILWDSPAGEQEFNYQIYRYEKGKKPAKLALVKTNEYLDKTVAKGRTYYYYVCTISPDGIESEKSKETYFTY